jgi:hypothetical protein
MAAVGHVSLGNRRRGRDARARKRKPAARALVLPATLRFWPDRPAPARTDAWRRVPVPAASRAPGAWSRPRHGGWQANGGRTIDGSRLNSGRKCSPASPGVAERGLKAVFGCGSPAPRVVSSDKGTGQFCGVLRGGRPGGADADEKTAGIGEPVGPSETGQSHGDGRGGGSCLRAAADARRPRSIATRVMHGGRQAIAVFVGTIVLTFGIGATLTGAVFILTEDH